MKKLILIIFMFLSLIIFDSCFSSKKGTTEESVEMKEEMKEEPDTTIIYKIPETMSKSEPPQGEEITISEDLDLASIEEDLNLPPVAREGVEIGTLVYDMDTAFYYNVISRVKAKISSKYHVKITSEIILEFNPAEEDLEDYEKRLELDNIVTSEVMDMKLYEVTPNTFNITQLSSNDQTVEEGWTTWEWSILPLQPGKYNLRLIAIIKDEDDHNKDKVVFDKEIDVQVKNKASWYLELFNNSLKLLEGYWFILSVLIVPLFVWIRKRMKKD